MNKFNKYTTKGIFLDVAGFIQLYDPERKVRGWNYFKLIASEDHNRETIYRLGYYMIHKKENFFKNRIEYLEMYPNQK